MGLETVSAKHKAYQKDYRAKNIDKRRAYDKARHEALKGTQLKQLTSVEAKKLKLKRHKAKLKQIRKG